MLNSIDELLLQIIDNFNKYIISNKFLDKINLDINFIIYHNKIIEFIKNYVESIDKNIIINSIKTSNSNVNMIYNIIKKYCAYYIYLSIGYYYKGSRDLFITNIIEISKLQEKNTYQIPNFFNSETNSKIINYFNDIKNILSLLELKTIDKIKLILSANPLKYESTIKMFNLLGEDYIIDYILIKDNYHNLIKSILFKLIYLLEDKTLMLKLLNSEELNNVEYKYIDIVISNQKKIVDLNFIQKFVTSQHIKYNYAEEIYNYLEEYKNYQEFVIKENIEYINYLFINKILIPISEDFIRYHKDTEKYLFNVNETNIKERDATKIKYIINKINNVSNYYSNLLDSNAKLKLEIQNLFFKPLDDRLAVLYNEIEEIKIIQKLENSDLTSDKEYLIDLENIRKYSYLNFKNLSKDGFKYRPTEQVEAVRYINILNKKKTKIETRIANNDLDINVVGVIFNPLKLPLNNFTTNDLINIKENESENGINKFINKITKTSKKNDKLYYWLFNNKVDKPNMNTYINYNINDSSNNIKIMLEYIYNIYYKLIFKNLNNELNKKDLNLWELNNIIQKYSKNYLNLNLFPQQKNETIENAIINLIKKEPIIYDEYSIVKKDIIKLPSVKIDKKDKKKIIINEDKKEIYDINKKNLPICYHYIKWKEISKQSKNTENYNQNIYEFIKKYVKQDKNNDYICKSCNEFLNLDKFIFEGTYVEELDVFLTTNLEVKLKLTEIPKYQKYSKTIKNVEKMIENIAYLTDLNILIGNTPVIKVRRKLLIKDTIDLLLLHNEWLKIQPKTRIENYNKKYGINKELTNLFFFELQDEIFLTSSTDTDYYKIIKYNNIIAYIIFQIIMEINIGLIINLKSDKQFNFIFFEKLNENIFLNLYIRKNQKEKIALINLPVLGYLLYYFSGILVIKNLWLWKKDSTENTQLLIITTQKIIIHTIIDLINTIIEANIEENKNYLYELIYNKFFIKLKDVFSNVNILNNIKNNNLKYIKVDNNKISLLTKKIDLLELNFEDKSIYEFKKHCNIKTVKLKTTNIKADNNNINIITNCPSGKFHKWIFKNNDLLCEYCSSSYNELIKNNINNYEIEISKNDINYINKIKNINLINLNKKYCISGEIHEFNENNICIKCNKNINTFIPNNDELKLFEKNLEKKSNENFQNNINYIERYNENKNKLENKINKIINKFNNNFNSIIVNKIDNYIITFIERLIKILSNKITINNNPVFLQDTVYIIDHDYLGISNNKPISILASDDKIIISNNHPLFNKSIIYYKDKQNNMYVYYDLINLLYLGYSNDNTTLKTTKNIASLKINYSVKDMFLFLGYENKYVNLYYYNKELKINTSIITDILRNRINNLKYIILRFKSILYNISNNGVNKSNYNIDEKQLINEYTNKFKVFNLKNENNKKYIFKNDIYILNKLVFENNIPLIINYNIINNYIDISFINNFNNLDIKILYYLIFNLHRLLDYNNNSNVIIDVAILIIKIIKYFFNMYFIPINNLDIRKFDYSLLFTENKYNNDKLIVSGYYNELIDVSELDNPNVLENNIDSKEAFESIDIDDYDVDDEVDGNAEALDGYDDNV